MKTERVTGAQYTEKLIRSAILLAAEGFCVFPAVGKRPAVTGWQRTATRKESTIRNWFDHDFREANLAVATGESSTCFVLDVDNRKNGLAALEALEAGLGELPDTLRARTPSGGLHLFFRHPGWQVPNVVGLIDGVGIDVKGDGGLVSR